MIQLSIENRIATLTLDRPEKRNALDDTMAAAILGHLETLKADDNCKVLIIKANGEAFCAGADLAYLQKLQMNSYEENLDDSLALMNMFRALYEFPKVTIAQVEGAAFAGGCGLAGLCDFCFASPAAKFAYTEVKIGFIPAIVSVFLSPKIGENAAKRMLLTGDVFSASEALEMRLITEIADADQIASVVQAFAEKICTGVSAQSLACTKQLLLSIKGLALEDQLVIAAEENARTRGSEDCKKGIAAFLNKEKLSW